MIYFLVFISLIAVIAIVTNRLNTKTPCNHNWQEHDNTVSCSKCGKKIPDHISSAAANQYHSSIHEAA